jgi:biotin transport system substrate-specific component
MSTTTSNTEVRKHVSQASTRQSARILARVAAAVGFAVATALAANVAVPLPGTPVPMTLQTLVVVLSGVALGPRWGTLSMAFYLLLGTAGYHAFAGGHWGLMTVCGATGGYLLGFVLAQPAIGRLTNAARPSFGRMLLAAALGDAVIFACGLLWMHAWTGQTWAGTLAWGLWPFLAGETLKVGLAAPLGQSARRRIRRLF